MYVEYDVNIIALMILAVVLMVNIKNGVSSLFRQQLFRAMIFCDMLILIIDAATLVLHGQQGKAVHEALYVLQGLFFFLCVLFCLLWVLFCTLLRGRRLRMRGYLILGLPLLAVTVFLMLNKSGDLVYGITQANIYFRGTYFYIIGIGTYFYIAYALLMVLRNRKIMDRREYYPHLLLPLLPTVVGGFQLFLEVEVLLVWPSVAVGLLVVQLFALNAQISVDHLTGLYNRKYLDNYLEGLLQRGDTVFAALMLDIDCFKKINDDHGHVEGDKAIAAAAEMLKRSVRKGDFVSRYGGDEFLIILEKCNVDTPARVMKRLRENLNHYNKNSKKPYCLDFSVGFKLFSPDRKLKAKDIFFEIDRLMYNNKQSKTR